MSQAEIAGGAVTPPNELPSKGRLLRDFELTSALGAHIQLSDYRGRSNLVLIFADDQQPAMTLLSDTARQYAPIKNEQAEIAGGAVTPPNELPSKGRLLRDFELTSALGAHIQLSDYRGRSNLVLIRQLD